MVVELKAPLRSAFSLSIRPAVSVMYSGEAIYSRPVGAECYSVL